MVDHIPPEMRKNNRPIDSSFAADEALYIRFETVEENGSVPVDQIRSTNQSVNRGKYSQPKWVLITEKHILHNWGYGSFYVKDLPCHVFSDGGAQCWFSPSHNPLDWNYSHSEILARKGAKNGPPVRSISSPDLKLKYRLKLREIISVIKMPGSNMESY
jgi:hypothetical protein